MPEPATISQPTVEYTGTLARSVEGQVDQLRKHYDFERPDHIIEFLIAHTHLIPLLLDAVAPLRRAFGHDPKLQLKTLDWNDAWILYADVLWTGSAALAQASLERFDESWWRERSPQARCELVFNFEFV